MYNNTQETSKPQKQETWGDAETNKGTQRGLQQTPKWNKGHYKKGDIWLKDNNTKHKRGVEQKYGKPQKK
jgi:hypothetical protein